MQHCLSFIRLSSLKLRKEGFTLLELLVTMAIFGLVVGIGTAQYQAFNRGRMLKNATASAVSNLRLVQGRALSGEKPGGVGCLTFKGYQVSYVNATSYQVQPYCSTATGDATVGNSTTYTLPPGIVFGNAFSSFRLLPVAQGADAARTLTLKEQNGTTCYGVDISTSGDIVDRGEVAC